MERDTGVEPVPSPWKGDVLPLYESRVTKISYSLLPTPYNLSRLLPLPSPSVVPQEYVMITPSLKLNSFLYECSRASIKLSSGAFYP